MTTPTLCPGSTLHLRALAFYCATALALLAGCASRPSRDRHPSRPQQPPLTARGEYFSGAILAEARVEGFHLNPAFAPHPDGGDRGGAGGHDRREHGMGPPPGVHPGGGFGEHHGTPPGDAPGREDKPALRRAAAMPGQTLHITFTNRGTSTLTVTVTELNSLLGNFAPRPDRLTIAAGVTASLDPVSGDAGGTLRWLDVTLTLRQGASTESHVLHLVGDDVPPSPPPPPAR